VGCRSQRHGKEVGWELADASGAVAFYFKHGSERLNPCARTNIYLNLSYDFFHETSPYFSLPWISSLLPTP
jgi:hypothetical protein